MAVNTESFYRVWEIIKHVEEGQPVVTMENGKIEHLFYSLDELNLNDLVKNTYKYKPVMVKK